MTKPFKHPLARNSLVAKAHRRDGSQADALVIVTTLDLDPAAKGYKADLVERLHEAARAFLAEKPDLTSYAVVNRPKDWKN